MKDWNDAYKAGVDIRALADGAPMFKPNGSAKTTENARSLELILRCGKDIKPEQIEWLWEGRLARGKHTAIAGEPGLGKSQAGIDIAATITRGKAWPNGEGTASKGRVVILSAEDDAADTIVPRLIAAGADLDQVEILQAIRQDNIHRPFSLQTDLCLLEEKLRALGDVRLIEIDPISAYFGGSKKADSHNDVDVRTVLAPVTDMANRLDIAILSIQDFNKSSGGIHAKSLHKFMGSIAFVAGPRMAFAIIEDSDNALRRLFLHVKNNLAPPPPGLAFQIEQAALVDYGMTASRIAWEAGTVNITADEAISAVRSKDVAPALEEAKQFLASLVGQESMSAKQIEKEAKEAGLSWATVRRAKDELGYKSVKAGLDDGWVWKR